MKQILSSNTVKKSLSAHSWLGLLGSVLLYLVCISGTLAVFYPQWQRWEQPKIEEYQTINPSQLQQAYESILTDSKNTHHMYITLPTDDMPRTLINSDTKGVYLNADGSIAKAISHKWTDMLTQLHVHLHMPYSIGLIIVGITGAIICALIISGILSHPRIFRDAFRLRLSGGQLQQADIHNRLSVWGAPFYLVLAITGACMGLATPVNQLIADAMFERDAKQVIAAVYGKEPELQQNIEVAAIDKVLISMSDIAPEARPFYVTVEDVATPQQYIIVGASHKQRLIYAEQYRFNSTGKYLDKVGFSDGIAASQITFSFFRLHFGHFAGQITKILYLIFGLAMTVVTVTGVNIWLVKRKHRDAINNLWIGCVWGTPLALALTALLGLLFNELKWTTSLTMMFWISTSISVIYAQISNNLRRSKALLQFVTALILFLLVIIHITFFGITNNNYTIITINSSLIITALIFIKMAKHKTE